MKRQDPPPPALGTLLTGIGFAAAKPRVWVSLTVLLTLLALVASYPVRVDAQASFEHVAGFSDEQPWLDLGVVPRWMFDDQGREQGGLGAPEALAPLLLLVSLLGVLITAGWMETAIDRRRENGLMGFLAGGGRFFFPFLRLWLVALGGYALCTWIVYGYPGDWLMGQMFPDGNPERATNENHARWAELGYSIVYLWGLLKVEVITDLARAHLVVTEKRSALGGLMRGIGFWMRRWWSCLALVGGGLLLEFAVVAGLVSLQGAAGFPLWVLALAVPPLRIILRGGRYAGLALYVEQVREQKQRRPLEHAPPPTPVDPIQEGSAWTG